MPSKYKQKLPKPITKQGDSRLKLLMLQNKYPVCTNCGRVSSLVNPTYSKCNCGGTYQLFGKK